jgi:hypothetical protein
MGYVIFRHSRGYDFTLWRTFIEKEELESWLDTTTIPRDRLLVYQDIEENKEGK